MRTSAALLAAALAVVPPLASGEESARPDDAAQSAMARQDWKALERIGREEARRHPERAGGWVWLGSALANQGRGEEALAALEQGAKVGDSAHLRHLVGRVHMRLGRMADAERELLRSMAMDGGYNPVYADLAQVLLATGKDEAARQALRTAVDRLGADHPEIAPLGEAMTQRYVERLPDPVKAQIVRAGRASLANQDGEAERGWREVAKLAPEFGDAYYNLGRLSHMHGDLETAEGQYRLALARYEPYDVRSRADALAALADVVAKRRPKDPEARAAVEHAIALRGEQPRFLAVLGRACDAVGDAACAAAAWRKVVDSPTTSEPVRQEAQRRLRALKR